MPAEGELSKRYMVSFARERAVQNVAFFQNSLKATTSVMAFWYRRLDTGMKWKAFAYVVCEAGHKPWDTREAHVSPTFKEGKPGFECVTEFTAEEFIKAVEEDAEPWYTTLRAQPLGRLAFEPWDEKRDKAGERWYDGFHHPKVTK